MTTICNNCGRILADYVNFCPKCGTPTPSYYSHSGLSQSEPTARPSSADALDPKASTDYGSPPHGMLEKNPYDQSPYGVVPPPPPRQGRSSLVIGIVSGIVVSILILGVFSTFALLTAREGSSSVSPTSSSSVPTTPPTPTSIAPGTILYQADWSQGLDGWVGSQDWKTQDGMLVSDGTNQPTSAAGPTILAPYQVTASGNFAIEIRVAFKTDQNFSSDPLLFHGSSTADGWQGYKLTVCVCPVGNIRLTSDDYNDVLGRALFDPGTAWHTYRVEVRGSTMTVIVDGTTLLTVHDSRYLSGGQVGIKSSTQITVSSFTITSL